MMSQDDIQAVAFDLDGLMFNTETLYIQVAEEMLLRRGHQLDMRMIHKMMGLPANVAYQIMIQWYELTDCVEKLEAETRDLFDRLLPVSLAPMPGLLELLREIDRVGLPKAIVTSSGRQQLERILDTAQLPAAFDFTLTADDVDQGKPHPEIYQMAAGRFGVDPCAMVVLEDSELGCRAALAARATTIAVPGPHNAHAQYDGVAMVAESLADPRLRQLVVGNG